MTHYLMWRIGDKAGDTGSMSQSVNPETGTVEGDRPTIGNFMRVGSFYARTFHSQDYWQTTPVTEIKEERENFIRFKTKNSEYIWEKLP